MSVTVAFDVQRLDTVHTVTDPIPTTGTPVEIGIEMVRHRSIPTLDSDVIAVRVGVVHVHKCGTTRQHRWLFIQSIERAFALILD